MTDMAELDPTPIAAPKSPPFLHRIIALGQMRYWIIGCWALALSTTVGWSLAFQWFVATLALGLVRTLVETSFNGMEARRLSQLKLAVATLSCVAWAVAPLLSMFAGHGYGLTMAVALLMAGYTLVFTQMRSAPREALIVSAPYSIVVCIIVASLWGDPGALTILAMVPVLGLAMLIKVVITDMKDSQLEEVNDRQADLIDELGAARDRANAASDAKSSFLAVVSHELRTPMNGVLGAAQLLDGEALTDRQRSYVSIIRQSGEGLLVQLNDILDMTKIEAGKMELSPADTVFADLCERAVGPFRAQAEAKGLDFVLDATGDLPGVVHVDALRIGQITHNLLSNAVKFTREGEVRMDIASTRLADDRARLTISVTDSGAGIAADDLTQLFQPFTQVDASSTRRFGGTGLGLSICRRLAHLMGGEIEVTSRLDQGSVFVLEIDVDVVSWPAAIPDEAVVLAEPAETRALRLLVVEDHPVNRIVLEAWLRSMGHDCAMAENGAVALEQAEVEAFDAIIMDINMPVMDGLTATRRLRDGSGPNRDTPVAVLSASARPEDHALGFAAGADAYVDKPVDFAALARVLAAAPEGRASVRGVHVTQAAA